MKADDTCPCGTGEWFAACCGRFIDGGERPETAAQLMRSRYTAYTLRRGEYLRATWHPTTRREDLALDEPVSWLGLKVIRTESGGVEDQDGKVEFVVRYKIGGRAYGLHELSRFVRRNGVWLYVDGDQVQRPR